MGSSGGLGANATTISNLVVPFFGSDLINTPQPPQLQSPNANSNTPTQAQTNTTALQTQLSDEHNQASTSTLLTGGQGLLDQPTTTSKVLLGS